MYVEYTVTQLHADSASLRRTASMNESSTAGAATGSMIRAHSAHLGLPSSFPGGFRKVKPSPSLPVLQQPRGRAAEPFDGQKAAVGLAWAFGARRAARRPVCLKKPLHRGVARWLSAGQPFERFAWLGCYDRDLLAPARCADLPPVAREAGQHWPRRRSFGNWHVLLAGSGGTEARCAASGRCRGFAQSCVWR